MIVTIQATAGRETSRTEHSEDNCPEAEVLSKKRDRRVERTKRALLEALVSCMIEKGYEESSVADIVERANVGRSTFYAHYADKEDLLQESILALMAHLKEEARATPSGCAGGHPALSFVRPMLEHVKDMQVLFRALAARPSGAAVQKQIHLALTDLVRQDLETQSVRVHGHPGLVAEFIVGAFLSVCFWWMSRDKSLHLDEVERIFLGLLTPELTHV